MASSGPIRVSAMRIKYKQMTIAFEYDRDKTSSFANLVLTSFSLDPTARAYLVCFSTGRIIGLDSDLSNYGDGLYLLRLINDGMRKGIRVLK